MLRQDRDFVAPVTGDAERSTGQGSEESGAGRGPTARKKPKLIQYPSKLDRYNARYERACKRGKRWAESEPHKPGPEEGWDEST